MSSDAVIHCLAQKSYVRMEQNRRNTKNKVLRSRYGVIERCPFEDPLDASIFTAPWYWTSPNSISRKI